MTHSHRLEVVLREELETLLNENPDLVAELAQIMESDAPVATPKSTNIDQKIGDNANVVGQINDTGSIDFSRKS